MLDGLLKPLVIIVLSISLNVNIQIGIVFVNNELQITKGDIAMSLYETKSEKTSMINYINAKNTNDSGARGCLRIIERLFGG